jgi:hypothetical protein
VEPAASVSEEGRVALNPEQPDEALRPSPRFDGTDDRLVVPHAPELSFKATDAFTLAAWVQLPEERVDGWQGIVCKSRDQKPWYGLWIEGDGRYVFGGPTNIHGGRIKAGWHHVGGVQSDGRRTLYVDGRAAGSGEAQPADGPGDLWIGGSKSVREFFRGAIEDVRLYRRALSHPEVARLAASKR